MFNLDELNSVGESIENYGFNIIMIRDEIREKMIEFAINHNISIYDASYIALAEKFNTQLITADEKIVKKLPKNLKLLILNLKNYNEDKIIC